MTSPDFIAFAPPGPVQSPNRLHQHRPRSHASTVPSQKAFFGSCLIKHRPKQNWPVSTPATSPDILPLRARLTPPHSSHASQQHHPDAFREECGVIGIFNCENAARIAFYGLHALQHRGQEGAGMVISDMNKLREVKGLGLVSEVFTEEAINTVPGSAGIGHVRYSTAGEKSVKNVQPFTAQFREGSVSIAHNGNLTNANTLRAELELRGSIFNTSSDTEVVLHLMATSLSGIVSNASIPSTTVHQRSIVRRAADALNRVEGAYSMVILTVDQLIAVRDPYGFRPLVLGKLPNSGYIVASESCVFDLVGAEYIREIEPGEMITTTAQGITSYFPFPRQIRRSCVFEHIYFANTSSIVFGRSVYMSRFRFGQILANVDPVKADCVVPVPESGVPAALGYASVSKIPFQQGIIRSHYVGRTFIQPTQQMRDIGVKLKLAPIRSLIRGKSLIVVDDSIVRGTTSKKIVNMLRDAGAKEIHFRIACPPIVGSCYYGVDTPNKNELISNRMDLEQTRLFIGADSLAYLPLALMHDFLGDESAAYCDACFSKNYPLIPDTNADGELSIPTTDKSSTEIFP